jgi:hypothetical protein
MHITVTVNSYLIFSEVFKMMKIVSPSVPEQCVDLWKTIDVSKEPAAFFLYHEK